MTPDSKRSDSQHPTQPMDAFTGGNTGAGDVQMCKMMDGTPGGCNTNQRGAQVLLAGVGMRRGSNEGSGPFLPSNDLGQTFQLLPIFQRAF